MSSVEVLPLDDYPDGITPFGPVDIPNDASVADVGVQRCTTGTPTIWPLETTVAIVALEYRVGTGEWTGGPSSTSTGGIAHGKHGAEVPVMLMGGGVPEGEDRQIRGSLAVSGGPMRTLVTFEIS